MHDDEADFHDSRQYFHSGHLGSGQSRDLPIIILSRTVTDKILNAFFFGRCGSRQLLNSSHRLEF